jgi:hypothetical protein
MSIEDQTVEPIPQEEFDLEVAEMVADWAPRLFAVVQEYGTRMDARIAAWGLAHEDGVDVIGVGNSVRLSASRPEDMLRYYNRRDRITARIVWPGPAATTSDDAS